MYYISENPKTYLGHNISTSIIRLIRHNKEVSKEDAVQIESSMVKKVGSHVLINYKSRLER